MRIHHLHIEAIGPFAGAHDVDFEQLSANGLFLLEGPTGAGKSTLIDAITYGLYGTLGKALDSRLPSAHAPLADPVIEVVFSTSAGIYRTRRTPPYERPKKRGDGFTTQNATARLWRLSSVEDAVGEPMAASTQEVGAEMQQILGLTRDQFMQTVVLPQGRFSTFLRAKPEERAVVLRDVFGTAIYQRVQDQLAEMARAAKRSIMATEGEVSSTIRSFVNLLHEGDPSAAALSEAGSALDTARMTHISDDVLSAMGRECDVAEDAIQTALTEEAGARTLLETQKELQRTIAQRRTLLADLDALESRTNEISADRERLAAAQRAATVLGALRAHIAATTGMAGAEAAVTAACSQLTNTPDADLSTLVEGPALRAVIDRVSGERGGLAEVVRLEAGLAARARQITEAKSALTLSVSELDAQRALLADRPEGRNTLTIALDELRRSATPVAMARQGAEQSLAVREAARRAEELATDVAQMTQKLARVGADARTATEHENAIRVRWINSTAGILAAGLEDGVPCPVCGGVEHPQPAPELPDHASLSDVDAATERRQHVVAALQDAERSHARVTADLRTQLELARHTPVPAAEDALALAEAQVSEAEEAVRRIAATEKDIADFAAGTDAITARISRAETSTATAAERLRGDRHRMAADETRCCEAAGDSSSVAVRVGLLDARLARARMLAEKRQDHHDAEHRLTDATVGLGEALQEAEFPDTDAVRHAQLTAGESNELQQRVRTYEAGIARVSSGLAEERVATLTGDEVADVPAAAEVHEMRHAALMAASATHATAKAALDQCDRARRTLVKVLERHHRLAESAAPVLRMGDLATAGEGNAKSTTLSTFVLLRRFEDVVAAANDRLCIMSDGRFSLRRIDEREGRAHRAGLGLSVRDHHTETNRDPHTLSGGETFYVSLCLALGLADVVTSEAGGISLDTLFIDEGFGSLDSDTLDGVLGELARLQAGGRAVGIVSHVAELKTRISERVEITRRPGGGSTLTVRT